MVGLGTDAHKVGVLANYIGDWVKAGSGYWERKNKHRIWEDTKQVKVKIERSYQRPDDKYKDVFVKYKVA